MSTLENTIISMAKQMLLEMRHLIATPMNTEEDQAMAKKFNITTDDLRNNEIANKMIEVKTLTQISFHVDNGLSEKATKELHKIDDECSGLMRTHAWIFSK